MRHAYDSSYFPPAPTVEIYLAEPEAPFTVGPLAALLDTGADASIIPLEYVQRLPLQIDNRKYLRSQWGEARRVDVYLLDIGVDTLRLPVVEVVADEQGEEVILGRNFLNQLLVTLNGPQQFLEISE